MAGGGVPALMALEGTPVGRVTMGCPGDGCCMEAGCTASCDDWDATCGGWDATCVGFIIGRV